MTWLSRTAWPCKSWKSSLLKVGEDSPSLSHSLIPVLSLLQMCNVTLDLVSFSMTFDLVSSGNVQYDLCDHIAHARRRESLVTSDKRPLFLLVCCCCTRNAGSDSTRQQYIDNCKWIREAGKHQLVMTVCYGVCDLCQNPQLTNLHTFY